MLCSRLFQQNRPDLCYHEFPADPAITAKWEKAAKRADGKFKSIKHRHICSEHFLPSDYRRSLTGRRILKPGTVPSVFKARETNTEVSEESPRSKRFKERNETDCNTWRTVFNLIEGNVVVSDQENRKPLDTTDSRLQEAEEQLRQLNLEVQNLKEKVSVSRFALERFSSNSDDIYFYTGFPDYECLLIFWEKIQPVASNLTRWESVRRKTTVSSNVKFPYCSNIAKACDVGRQKCCSR